ncbi:MAG: hypothetical protein RLY43_1803 [Bacteroidota bacterium]|jgi:glycosyltransferase involved in cell wall biosynthesis
MLKKILISYHRFPSIAKDLSDALINSGVDVELFYVDDYQTFFYKRIIKPIRKFFYYCGFKNISNKIFFDCKLDYSNFVTENFKRKYEEFKPDMIFVIQGAPHSLQYISTLNVFKVGWWIEPSDEIEELLINSSPFDFYYCFSLLSIDRLGKYKKNIGYMNHFVDRRIFRVLPDVSKKYDLVFVGNWSEWRDDVIRAVLSVTSNIVIYGPRWRSRSDISSNILKKIHMGNHIEGQDLNLLYNKSKIVLNAARKLGSNGLNMRFTEALSAGSFLVTDMVAEIPTHFLDGESLVVFQNLDDLKRLVNFYLKYDARRNSIAINGEKVINQNYDYSEFANKIIRLYSNHAINSSLADQNIN